MKITVVIPTYNRPVALKECLIALQKQTFDKPWEIIVVDDGSKTILNTLIEEPNTKPNITLIKQDNAGPASARNKGVSKAKGEYITFLDDDCEPEADWLATLYSNAKPNIITGGKTRNKLTYNRFSETSQQLVSFLYKEWEGSPWYFFTSNNFMVDKETFLSLGGFDESFRTSAGEDREFCARWIHSGYQMQYVPTAIVNHSHDLKFRSFWKMHLKYGEAAPLLGKRIRQIGVDTLKPRISFYVSLFAFVLRHKDLGFKRSLSVSLLIFISQLATLFGFVKEKLRH